MICGRSGIIFGGCSGCVEPTVKVLVFRKMDVYYMYLSLVSQCAPGMLRHARRRVELLPERRADEGLGRRPQRERVAGALR